jgi:hypothetical protein
MDTAGSQIIRAGIRRASRTEGIGFHRDPFPQGFLQKSGAEHAGRSTIRTSFILIHLVFIFWYGVVLDARFPGREPVDGDQRQDFLRRPGLSSGGMSLFHGLIHAFISPFEPLKAELTGVSG